MKSTNKEYHTMTNRDRMIKEIDEVVTNKYTEESVADIMSNYSYVDINEDHDEDQKMLALVRSALECDEDHFIVSNIWIIKHGIRPTHLGLKLTKDWLDLAIGMKITKKKMRFIESTVLRGKQLKELRKVARTKVVVPVALNSKKYHDEFDIWLNK